MRRSIAGLLLQTRLLVPAVVPEVGAGGNVSRASEKQRLGRGGSLLARWSLPLIMSLGMIVLSSGGAGAQSEREIRGRVLNQDLRPVAGVVVEVLDLGRSTVSGVDGYFRFDDVPEGDYLLRAETEARGTAVARVRVPSASAGNVVLDLNPAFHLDQIVVAASPTARTREELFQAAQALTGRDLRRRLSASLGETVAGEPGVSATYFGPAASRPVIRGLGGDRVRVLEAGVGTGDASSTSPDHAVSVEPHHAERIEIVRGPATLLYGSSAIGGVVNVIDGRIPRELPLEALTGEVRILGSSVAQEGMVSGELETAVGSWGLHGGALFRDTDDYSIPGYADAHAAEEGATDAPFGVLPNSAVRTSRLTGGISRVGADGYLGASVSGYDSRYGVPGHGHHDEPGAPAPAPGEGSAAIEMEQRRLDLEGRWRFQGAIRGVQLRIGLSEYEHVELEGAEVGTRFLNDAREGRVEIQHALAWLEGAGGVQASRRDFAALGEEAFVPPTETDLLAVFLFEEAAAGPVRFQAGGRLEWQESRVDGATERSFTGTSLSGGISWTATDALSVAVSASRSIKLPNAEELFSDGPHLATRAWELGDPGLDEEVGRSLDLTAHVHGDRLEAQIAAFVTDFDGFIHRRFTGSVVDGLRVLRYGQDDARFMGLEGQADVELFHRGATHLILELSSDWVRAELTSTEEHLPRIPPARAGAGLRFDAAPWSAGLGLTRAFDQERVAAFEEPTTGYTTVDAEVGYRFVAGGTAHEIALTGRNLTNVEARNHVSLLKEEAPLPGRDLRLAYRLAF